MIQNILEDLVKLYGSKMPASDFVKRFKEHKATAQKLYYYLKKNNLPTHREWKRINEEFDMKVISDAKEKIAEINNKKGQI